MVKEAYVSSEIQKLLLEKGFSVDEYEVHYISTDRSEFNITYQMAMRWLREEKGLFIEICCDDLDYDWQIFDVWHRDSNGDPTVKSESYGGYSEYEKAVETALMFLFKFLI